ncbi:MAG: aminotransferase class V-fold PLP-dependent enzyme, partial [Oscillospiraceae bacterium]|nr:aminotransferase class V-fold PLP-dependent enzyme [Oscillospiraceae bacterium]
MTTPICDFVRRYAASGTLRLHMPGHKGTGALGFETLDITEIDGADVLYSAEGIIAESQQNAAFLFGSGKTFYSCEGSSLSIRAMLCLARLWRGEERPLILAARNAHKAFLSAATLLDLDVEWLSAESGSLLECRVDGKTLEKKLAAMEKKPAAVYITSPDYLGNTAPIAELADVAHRFGALLLVDNAHGAYLRFLPTSRHPLDLGADMCADSAHKTLGALTPGAYLHISKNAPEELGAQAMRAMELFATTSPSYLLLQSLDALNAELAGDFR